MKGERRRLAHGGTKHGLNIDCSLYPSNKEAVADPVNEILALEIELEHHVFL